MMTVAEKSFLSSPASIFACRRSTSELGNASLKALHGRESFQVEIVPGVGALARNDWNMLFPGHAEGWDYFKACEESGASQFELAALAVCDQETLIAAVPLFRVRYRLDMSFPEKARPLGRWLNAHAPRLVNTHVLCMGSPWSEECAIGFHQGLSDATRDQVLELVLQHLLDHASQTGATIVAVKDVQGGQRAWAAPLLRQAGFSESPTLPVATLALPFEDEAGYLASLSPKMRADLKSKLKKSGGLDFAVHNSIDDIENEIYELFRETQSRRKADYDDFDDVPPDYFSRVMKDMPGTAKVMACRIDGRIASFNLFFVEGERVIGKYIGMRYPVARENNLYFINWMKMVRYCLSERKRWLQTGQTGYQLKVRLGCRLKRSWVYFRHTNPVANAAFRMAAPWCAFDRMDPDMRLLGPSIPYLDEA